MMRSEPGAVATGLLWNSQTKVCATRSLPLPVLTSKLNVFIDSAAPG